MIRGIKEQMFCGYDTVAVAVAVAGLCRVAVAE